MGVRSSAPVSNLVASIGTKMTSLQNLCLYMGYKVTVGLGGRESVTQLMCAVVLENGLALLQQ